MSLLIDMVLLSRMPLAHIPRRIRMPHLVGMPLLVRSTMGVERSLGSCRLRSHH
jgi:hypothetical protein